MSTYKNRTRRADPVRPPVCFPATGEEFRDQAEYTYAYAEHVFRHAVDVEEATSTLCFVKRELLLNTRNAVSGLIDSVRATSKLLYAVLEANGVRGYFGELLLPASERVAAVIAAINALNSFERKEFGLRAENWFVGLFKSLDHADRMRVVERLTCALKEGDGDE
jgi:hypothetical protein